MGRLEKALAASKKDRGQFPVKLGLQAGDAGGLSPGEAMTHPNVNDGMNSRGLFRTA